LFLCTQQSGLGPTVKSTARSVPCPNGEFDPAGPTVTGLDKPLYGKQTATKRSFFQKSGKLCGSGLNPHGFATAGIPGTCPPRTD